LVLLFLSFFVLVCQRAADNHRIGEKILGDEVGMLTHPELLPTVPDLSIVMTPLRRHQMQALTFMIEREKEANEKAYAGGLLLDDAGLGKTLSVLSLICMPFNRQINKVSYYVSSKSY